MQRLILISIFVLALIPITTHAVWDASNYSNDALLELDATGIGLGSDVASFPVLIRITDSNIRNFWGFQTQDDGDDVRFTDSNGDSLIFELESWDNANQQAVFWVLINTVFKSSKGTITMHWNFPGAADGSQPDKVFATSNNFEGVWHLEGSTSTSSGAHKDATGNSNDATAFAGVNQADGEVGKGQFLDGSGDYLLSTSNISITGDANRTVSIWVNLDNTNNSGLLGWGANANDQEYMMTVFANEWQLWGWGAGNDWDLNTTPSTGTWLLVTVVHTSGTSRWYVNGDQIQSGFTNTYNTPAALLNFGRQVDGGGTNYLKGTIDEARVSDVARSTNWIKLSYENQKSSSTLISFVQPDFLELQGGTMTGDINMGRNAINSQGRFISTGGKTSIDTGVVTTTMLIIKDWTIEVPDYVFEPGYDLMPLSELSKYVKINKHLPGIPSQKEFENKGLNVAEMNLNLLKKLEELTLHLIKQEDEISHLEKRDGVTE